MSRNRLTPRRFLNTSVVSLMLSTFLSMILLACQAAFTTSSGDATPQLSTSSQALSKKSKFTGVTTVVTGFPEQPDVGIRIQSLKSKGNRKFNKVVPATSRLSLRPGAYRVSILRPEMTTTVGTTYRTSRPDVNIQVKKGRSVRVEFAYVAINSVSSGGSTEDVPAPKPDACEAAWYEHQYSAVAPGFPTTMSQEEASQQFAECLRSGGLPDQSRQVELTQRAFNTVAQLLERQIRLESLASNLPPCLAIQNVLKPVMKGGVPLAPGGDVEGYAADSFLPILRYNWHSGPFRLKYGVGCEAAPYANLWLMADPYPPAGSHPDRYPQEDAQWDREAVEGPMSTCISWGPELGNDGIGGEGAIFGFSWSRENLPLDVRSCYPRATGQQGLQVYPVTRTPVLPLTSS